MRRFWPLILFVIIFIVAVLGLNNPVISTSISSSQSPQRIISLAPSITESLFALGLGDKIVAVTDYCDYPPAARELKKVGGYINPNLETIVGLQPDLVILLAGHTRTVTQLAQLNIKTLVVNNSTLLGIQQTINSIGQRTGRQQQADVLLATIQQKIAIVTDKVSGQERPKVMIAMGHSMGNEQLKQIYIAGQHDFYNDLISLAGGINVYQKSTPKVPSLSIEGIMQLNPDIILDIFPEEDDHQTDLIQAKQRWQKLHYVNAIQHNRIHIIEENYATIPGPRIFQLLEQIAMLIHPNLDWSK